MDVAAGTFRKDLSYRLNVFSVTIPPLRARVDDIPILVEELLDVMAKRLGLPASPKVHHKAMRMLLDYRWPGNVRELKNVLERALLLGDKVQIGCGELGIIAPKKDEPAIRQDDSCFAVKLANGLTMPSVLHSAKQWLIVQALRRNGGRLDDAARQLGITRDSLKHHMKSLAIKRSDWSNGKSR
jgi:DNA-binding NtrC family response regulator